MERADFDEFYGKRFERTVSDSTAFMRSQLRKSLGGAPYRRFLTGHSGSGKSTELTRLSIELEGDFEFIRIMSQDELSPFSAQPFDLLHIMALRMVERSNELGLAVDESVLEELGLWFDSVVVKWITKAGGGIGGEMNVGSPRWLKWIFEAGAAIRGEAKYSSDRTEETIRQRLQELSALKALVNRVFAECRRLLKEYNGKDWVFLIEDLDKESVSEAVLDQLFVKYANLWNELHVHLICTIPLWLAFNTRGTARSVEHFVLVDIPVFDAEHRPYAAGRKILHDILSKRVSDDVFMPGVKEFLVQAAGGNLRDLFYIVNSAATFAELEQRQEIGMDMAEEAVNRLRNEYMRRLGETSPKDEIPYERKVDLLLRVYREGSQWIIQDPVLYRLLRSRVVHEYNGKTWYGVPPLIVDILIRQGRLPPDSRGGLERA